VHAVTPDSVREVDTVCWFDEGTAAPAVRAVVEHARLMLDADLSFPVILDPDGRDAPDRPRHARRQKTGQRCPLPDPARTGLPGLPARRSPILTSSPGLTEHSAGSA